MPRGTPSVDDDLSIGKGAPEDAEAIVALVLDAHRPYYRLCFAGDELAVERFLRAAVADERSEVFAQRAMVARLGGTAVGVAISSVAAQRSTFGRRDAYLLRSLLARGEADAVFARMRAAAASFAAPQPDSLYLARLAVDGAAQARGIGGRLVAALDFECAAAGLNAIELHVAADNQAATRFYEGQGFAVLGRAVPAQDGLPEYLHMRRAVISRGVQTG